MQFLNIRKFYRIRAGIPKRGYGIMLSIDPKDGAVDAQS